MEDTSTELNKTDFNSNLQTICRLDEIKKWLAVYNVNNDYRKRIKHLQAFHFEVLPIMVDLYKNKKDHITTMENAFWYSKIVEKKFNDDKATKEDVIFIDIWEKELRLVDQKAGMNMAKKQIIDEDPESWDDSVDDDF